MDKGIKIAIAENSLLLNKILWLIFFVYTILSGYAILNHEMWGDEIHSWNIAKGSAGFLDLFKNIRYEGHPPVWYIIIWTISKFTHNLIFVQAVHWIIASVSVFLLLFFSPLPFSTRLLIPFGYYFLFEYTVLSRNYAIGVLLAVCICMIIRKDFRYKTVLYYFLLFLLSNTHLIGILLAGSIHVYFLLLVREKSGMKSVFLVHALIGMIIVLPAIGFIFPPSDSEMNVQFWLNRWGMRNFRNFSQSPIRAFVPLPAWWLYNFWNSQFLLEWAKKINFFWIVNLAAAIAIVGLLIFILKKNRKALFLFTANLFFSCLVAMTFFTLGGARYAGFLYIGFIAAYWLYCAETTVTKVNKYIVNGLLLLQLFGSVQPVVEDIRFPFSNAYRIKELLAKVPADEKIVTDYWTLNAIAAFADKPFYCIDLQKEVSFIVWDGELKRIITAPNRFTDGVKNFFSRQGIKRLVIVSINPPDILSKIDPQLQKEYTITLIDRIEGAIETSSNLYLYEIKAIL
jgi:hypothetical protein